MITVNCLETGLLNILVNFGIYLFGISASRLSRYSQAPRVIEIAARYFEKFDKAQRDKLLIIEDPSLMFLIVKVARDQRVPGSLLARSRR